jgi:hypothetical protein
MTVVALVMMWSESFAQGAPSTQYWGWSSADGTIWCGYADKAEYDSAYLAQAELRSVGGSAMVIYTSGRLAEIRYEFAPASGDWVVIDSYTPSGEDLHLKRTNVLGFEGIRVIQEATTRGGRLEPLQVTSVTSLDGGPTDADAAKEWFPHVPVRARLDRMPFLAVAAEMHDKSVRQVCKRGAVTVTEPVPASVPTGPDSFWLVRKDDDKTWCGYASGETLQRIADVMVRYNGSAAEEIRLISDGPGWWVTDTYARSGKDWRLRRAVTINERQKNRFLDIVQETTIHSRRAAPFRLVSADARADARVGQATDGGKTPGEPDLSQPDLTAMNLPAVRVITDPLAEPFMEVVTRMRERHLPELCSTMQ